jgi:hypothetical protein
MSSEHPHFALFAVHVHCFWGIVGNGITASTSSLLQLRTDPPGATIESLFRLHFVKHYLYNGSFISRSLDTHRGAVAESD